MKIKSKISLAKAITLGLLLSAGVGYSTGVSASVSDNSILYGVTLGMQMGEIYFDKYGTAPGTTPSSSAAEWTGGNFPKLEQFQNSTVNGYEYALKTPDTIVGSEYSFTINGTRASGRLPTGATAANFSIVGDVVVGEYTTLTLENLPVNGQITGKGNLVIKGTGTITDVNDDGAFSVYIDVDNANAIGGIGGDVTVMNQGVIKSTKGSGIEDATGKVTITNSTVDTKKSSIIDVGNGVVIDGSNLTSNGARAIYKVKAGGVEVKNGSVLKKADGGKSDYAVIETVQGGDVKVTDSTIKNVNGRGIYDVSEDVIVERSIISVTKNAIEKVVGDASFTDSIVAATNGMGIFDVDGSVTINGYSTAKIKWNKVDKDVTASVCAFDDVINDVGKDVNATNAILVSVSGYGIKGVGEDVNLTNVGLLAEKSAIRNVDGDVTIVGVDDVTSSIESKKGNGIKGVKGKVELSNVAITADKDGINLTIEPNDLLAGEAYMNHDWALHTSITAKGNGINLSGRGSSRQFNLNDVTIDTQATGIKADNSSTVYLTKEARPFTTLEETITPGALAITLHQNDTKDNTVVGIEAKKGSIVDLTHGGDVSIKLNKEEETYDTVKKMTAVKAEGVLTVTYDSGDGDVTVDRPAMVLFKDLELSDVVATKEAYGFVAKKGAKIGGTDVNDDSFTYGTLKGGQDLAVEATGNKGVAKAVYAKGAESTIKLDMQGGDVTVNAEKGKAYALMAKDGATIDIKGANSIFAQGAKGSYAIYNDGGTIDVTFNGSKIEANVAEGNSCDAVAIYSDDYGVTTVSDEDGALSIYSFNYGTGDSVGVKAKDGAEVTVEQIGTAVIAATQGKATLVNARKDSTVTMNGVEDGATVAVAGYEGQTIAKGRGNAKINLSNMNIGLYQLDEDPDPSDPQVLAEDGTLLEVDGRRSDVVLNLNNVNVDGVANIVLDRGAEADVTLANSAFTGAIERGRHAKVDMTLDKDSTWGVTESSKVRNLNNAGTVDMTADKVGDAFKYSTLSVNELQQTLGETATFKLDMDMASDADNVDQVEIKNANVFDASDAPVLGGRISLNVKPNVQNFNDNDDVFAKLTSDSAPVFFVLDAGIDSTSFDVTINGDKYFDMGAIRTNVEALTDDNGNGYLTLVPATKNGKQALSAKGNAALSAVIDPETWYLDTEALNDNMDEYNSARPKQQVWAKYTNKKNVYDDSFDGKAVNNGDVDKKYNGIVLGWDNRVKTYEKSGAALYVGAMLTYGDGKYSWSGGSNEIDGKGIGLYGIYKTDKGAYVSAVMKYNKYTLDEIKGAQRGVIDGGFNDEYDSNAFGISLNAGRRYAKDLSNGFYYEPQVELGFVKYGNDNYDLDGMKVNVESMNSFRGRIGIQAGTHKVTGKGNFHDVYAKFSLNNEFSGTNDVRMGAYTFESDQGGAWVNFAIGGRVGNMDKFNADLSLNMSRGSHDSKAGFKVGFNWMF